jgi:hypothetical protein
MEVLDKIVRHSLDQRVILSVTYRHDQHCGIVDVQLHVPSNKSAFGCRETLRECKSLHTVNRVVPLEGGLMGALTHSWHQTSD